MIPHPQIPKDRIAPTIAGVLVIALFTSHPASARVRQESQAPAPKSITFMDDLKSAQDAAKQSGRPIVVIFGAVW